MILSIRTYFHVLFHLGSYLPAHEFSEQKQKKEKSFQSSARNILIILIYTYEKTGDHGSLSCWYFPWTILLYVLVLCYRTKDIHRKEKQFIHV